MAFVSLAWSFFRTGPGLITLGIFLVWGASTLGKYSGWSSRGAEIAIRDTEIRTLNKIIADERARTAAHAQTLLADQRANMAEKMKAKTSNAKDTDIYISGAVLERLRKF